MAEGDRKDLQDLKGLPRSPLLSFFEKQKQPIVSRARASRRMNGLQKRWELLSRSTLPSAGFRQALGWNGRRHTFNSATGLAIHFLPTRTRTPIKVSIS
jgi:hypothetical protein